MINFSQRIIEHLFGIAQLYLCNIDKSLMIFTYLVLSPYNM